MALSDAQYKAQVSLLILACLLSVFGSAVVMRYTYKNIRTSVGQRLLFLLSVSDTLVSLTFVLQPFLLNADKPVDTALWAIGNQFTCRVTGSLSLIFPFWVALASMSLALYYVTTVKYRWRDEHFTKRVEIYVCALALICPIPLIILALTTNSLNNTEIMPTCYLYSSPPGCGWKPDVECEQSFDHAPHFIFSVELVSVTVAAMVGVVSNIVLARHVRKQFNQMRGRQVGSHRQTLVGALRSRRTLIWTQATLYCISYVNMFCWKLCVFLMVMLIWYPEESSGSRAVYPVQVCFSFLGPLQVREERKCN